MNNKINNAMAKLSNIIKGTNFSSASKMKASIIAIIIGLAIGIIPIVASNGDFIGLYSSLFTAPFESHVISKSFTKIAIYILLGAGIAISFKTGLFNIGAAGQFLIASSLTLVLGIKMNLPRSTGIPILILISILAGAALSAIAGALKAFFNVHEVVSTILLNWIVFFLNKYIINLKGIKGPQTTTLKIHEAFKLDTAFENGTDYIWIFALAISLVVLIGLIFKFTTFGFRMKTNGENPEAAKYAGMNNKWTTIFSMALSGAFAGLAGFIYMAGKGITELQTTSLPTEGFQAITIALLAFSNPILCIPFGIIFSLINYMQENVLLYYITKETINLVIGIFIFVSAFAPVFLKFKPILWIRQLLFSWTNPTIKTSKKQTKSSITKRNLTFKKELLKFKKINKIEKENIKLAKKQYNKNDEEYRLFIFNNEIKKEMLRMLKQDWRNEINDLNRKLKIKNISHSKHGELFRKTNLEYVRKFEELELLKQNNYKKEYKTFISNTKAQYKIVKNEEWAKRNKNKKVRRVR